MASFFRQQPKPPEPALLRPALELSGPALNGAMERLACSCEPSGGVERFVAALKLREQVIRDVLADTPDKPLDADRMAAVAMFMPTVRRRIGPYVEDEAFPAFKKAVKELLAGPHEPVDADARMAAFCASFPNDRGHRWVRDMAAEALHAVAPERYPLMCRWVWDARSNTGVLREIWHGDVDHASIDIGDDYATFIMLREELSQFLTANGVYRDVLYYVDLICAQVYADYISAQGGSYLRADFSSAEDPAVHVRRLLGLDGVRSKTTRKGAELFNGAAALLEQG